MLQSDTFIRLYPKNTLQPVGPVGAVGPFFNGCVQPLEFPSLSVHELCPSPRCQTRWVARHWLSSPEHVELFQVFGKCYCTSCNRWPNEYSRIASRNRSHPISLQR